MSFRETVRTLGSKQKASYGAPAYSRFVNRPVGRYLAAAAYQAHLTPNAVTAISALFSLSAVILIAGVAPTWIAGIAICLCLVLGYAFDSADGQLARLRGGGSLAGEWLDHMVDATKISSLHLAVLISAYRFFDFDRPAWLLVPIGFTVVSAVSFFGMILNEQLERRAALTTGATRNRPQATSALRSLLVIPTDYGLLCLIFLLLGAPMVLFAAYTLLFVGNAGYLALAAVKWFRVMQSLDRRPTAMPTSEGTS